MDLDHRHLQNMWLVYSISKIEKDHNHRHLQNMWLIYSISEIELLITIDIYKTHGRFNQYLKLNGPQP